MGLSRRPSCPSTQWRGDMDARASERRQPMGACLRGGHQDERQDAVEMEACGRPTRTVDLTLSRAKSGERSCGKHGPHSSEEHPLGCLQQRSTKHEARSSVHGASWGRRPPSIIRVACRPRAPEGT